MWHVWTWSCCPRQVLIWPWMWSPGNCSTLMTLDEEAEYQLYVLRREGDPAPWEYERRRTLLEAEAV